MEAGRQGGSCPAVLSAADDVAVHSFLGGKIAFTDIPRLVDRVLSEHKRTPGLDFAELLDADLWATARAEELVKGPL
jgi:1-deoxy-D-xylulose-5-phosphate reductoisomerase